MGMTWEEGIKAARRRFSKRVNNRHRYWTDPWHRRLVSAASGLARRKRLRPPGEAQAASLSALEEGTDSVVRQPSGALSEPPRAQGAGPF